MGSGQLCTKVILVTGATSGVGYETAFAAANASKFNHVLLGARSLPKARTALASLQARSPLGTFSILELDLTRDSTITAAAKTIEADYGKLDVLINNASICDTYRLATKGRPVLDRQSIQRTIDTNAIGPFLLIQALEGLLRKSSDARIINVSSVLGSLGLRADLERRGSSVVYDAYRMSKAALGMVALSYNYHFREFAKVWAFCPGLVVTNLTGEEDKAQRQEWGANSPEVPAAAIIDIINGQRDGETGKFINMKEGFIRGRIAEAEPNCRLPIYIAYNTRTIYNMSTIAISVYSSMNSCTTGNCI
ncbi:short chain dehydrogenase [Fusarium austroafricanum]|uniref:Short chain dehydrogenase n=1 Tax=Fusarium austroafricanum TaxID=2364996 RepID=A0A8H4KL45_9HYPO|nr:short chain dehydrogenase [Fusarium austroafricanum]